MRVVFDTNIWISFLISNLLKGLDDLILEGKIEVVMCEEQLDEIIAVLRRPKFKKHFSEEDVGELLSILSKTATITKIGSAIRDCRDAKDDFILETAVAGNAGIIVTGDKNLLELNPYHRIKIMQPKQFEKVLSAARPRAKNPRLKI